MADTYSVAEGSETQERTGTAPPGALTTSQLKVYLEDCRDQPPWRNMADKCADYYDGNQLDFDTLHALELKGMGNLQRNIIQPLVNVVLGMEAKTRTDWRVSADNDAVQDVAEGLSAKLHEAERETRADRACSDGYGGQIKAGLGWVEVSRNHDPFGYPHRTAAVHRREIWWDWRDDSPELSKARYLIRKRWFDLDQAILYFPEKEDVLRAALGDPMRYEMLLGKRSLDLAMSLEEARGLDIEDIEEWRSFDRKRICLYEVWYRVFMRGWIAKLPNGEVVEVNTKNPVHIALLNRGAMRAEKAVYAKLRLSIWAGPHKLMDVASPKRHTPYVPFWGYREDRTGVPYGLVRAMLSPQDEVNARLQKMMWLLGAKRVVMESDALDSTIQSPQDMLQELARPDAVVFLNPKRVNRQQSFQVDDNLTLADAQFKILQDAMQSAQQVVGVFNAMLGRDSGTTANSALMTLVDQGTTALAEINDNYRFARRLVGERLLDQVRDDLIGQPVDVVSNENGRKRIISLNKQGQGGVENNVQATKVKVALDDVPSSAAYREQQFTMIAEMTKGLPPNLQGVIAPFVFEASDLQKRREMADSLRKAMGQPIPKTPEEERAAEEAQTQAMQFAAQVQQKQAMLELAEREAKVEKTRAEAEKIRADIKTMGAGDGAALEARMQAEQEIAAAEANARADIDRLTAEVMTVRMTAATREQKLLGELAKTVAELKANAANKGAQEREASIKKEIAEIEASRDRDVARINADSQKVIDAMADQMVKLRDDLKRSADEAKKAAERATQEVRDAEKSRKEDEARRKVEDKARREADAAAKAKAKEDDGDKEVEIRVKKVGDGSFVGTKTVKRRKK